MPTIKVQASDLEKVLDVLRAAEKHHRSRDEMNAALHLAPAARYSPLTSEIEAAADRIGALLLESS